MPKNLNLDVPISLPAGMPSVSLIKNALHILQVLGTVLTICVVAPIIAAENRFYGASQPGPNYTLFVGLSSVVIPVCMVVFPWLYDTKGKFRHFGKFFLKPRTSLIFTGFYTGFWCTAGIAMTVHANNPAHCNLDSDLQESYGDDYTGTWASQCTCGKAGAGLAWTTCILWLLSLLCTLIIFFNEKQMIQKNLKQHEMNKQAVLQMQQQQEEEDEWGDVERRGGYRPTSYYEQEEGEDLGGMRPQSFEQARPLHSPPQVHHHQTESSPFESPYDPPVTHYDPTAQYDPHNHGYPEQQHGQYSVQPDPAAQYDPHNHGYPEQHGQYAVQPEQSPFDDFHRQPSPEPPYQAAPTPPQHQQQFSPMPMPDPSHYSTQPHVDRF